tara:strand:+ start:476 stop:721 length:246 start_codon:yes stop_codon:yes gene_type:complete
MLCEKCKDKGIDCQMTAQAQGFAMGLTGRRPVHESGGKWFPGATKTELENWCAKNCKPVEEKSITPKISNEKSVRKDKKKD